MKRTAVRGYEALSSVAAATSLHPYIRVLPVHAWLLNSGASFPRINRGLPRKRWGNQKAAGPFP